MMKKLLFLAMIFFFAIQGKSQNEPELLGSIDQVVFLSQAKLIYIDHGLPKISIQYQGEITLYNLDFTLYKSVVIPAVFEGSNFGASVFYLTRSLFDCDTTNVEYYAQGYIDGDSLVNGIYNEDGSDYFNFENEAMLGLNTLGITSNESPIVSDAGGSYLLTSDTSQTHIYRLCGQVPQALARESNGTLITGIMEQQNSSGFDVYPNPARETIKFEYDLQGYKKANLQVFNTSGQLIKEMMLGQAFDFIRLNISDLEQGTYIARITTDDGFELSEKFVKVE